MSSKKILEAKQAIVDDLSGKLSEAVAGVIVNYQGISVEKDTALRAKLRAAGVAAELYPDSVKMKKQMSFANDHAIPYVVMVGESEMQSGQLSVKNMVSGEQGAMTIDELIVLVTKA